MSSLLGDRRAYAALGAAAVAIATLPTIYLALKATFKSKRVEGQYTSREFVLAAGAVPFQFDAFGTPKRVLLAHHAPLGAWLLSKGRKDEGEDLATAATREVFEETGYPCRLHPVPNLPTCAPLPAELVGTDPQPHSTRIALNSTEPFMITLRPIAFGMLKLKLIFWYIGAVDVPYDEASASSEMGGVQPGTHQIAEGFDEVRLFDIEEAIEKLAFDGDRDLVRTAVSFLTAKP
ncbi:hypothetical protein DICSQDRAFT_102180 [Dichomitus squalens LYAD-421 SS1]|uniref:uncharacterized protein n=1 Tax=Dichomitus squalens (strain LYAD-421) TaxID=732165 RepID=UPI00044127FF|nr:uncharacterized protein DICSQDRAFT_102180 [Dichomitus squalens LYAD-421 SS1]EJF63975.1 hypothetical protein DICSQDRAFT_102180 [Dichomitus squalens LYAD-421 SS1]